MYQAKYEKEDWQLMYTKWETTNHILIATQKTKALRELRVFELKNNLALDPTQRKRNAMLKRLHLFEVSDFMPKREGKHERSQVKPLQKKDDTKSSKYSSTNFIKTR